MRWIGQHIYDLISRFRSDVYLEDISTGTIASGGNLGLDSDNKIVKATISSGSGDITSVSITTDSGGGVASASQTSGNANFSILGTSGVGVTNSSETITVTSVPGEIDHDSLLNFAADEHFTQANITTVGTIGTGTWQGTAIASAYLDSDTAHLSSNQTFTGTKTFGQTIGSQLIVDGNTAVIPGDGVAIHVDASDVTDGSTSASGTATKYTHVNIENPRLLATNASVTTTDAATLYVKGAPVASINQTLTRAWSMWVDAGNARFDGSIYSGTTEAINSSGVIQVATQENIDHDSLANYAANEHFTQANITTVGTVGTGVWQGTAIATDQQKHLAYFDFKGYGTTDGTNYERQQIMTDNKAPFLHSLASGTDGLDDLEHYEVLRLGAHVMPRAGVLKKWQGWASSAGTGTINMSIVKATPVANTTDDVTPVLVKNTQFTAVGNSKVIEIDETSFSVGFAEGDMLYTVVLGSTASKLWYLSSTVEVEWT